jgi:16S rRNA (cytidine1402-2'-O)-methyltransferase
MSDTTFGTLYIVATPIGNLEDLTPRAVSVLGNSAFVACEDTRRTGRLLKHLDISTRLISYHDHNEERSAARIVSAIERGDDVAVVSDAGTPGVSDPAYRVIRAALEAGITVMAVPGASAVLSALVVSGMPLDRFVFEGFLPPKSGKRRGRLEALALEQRTIVLYESPYRVVALIEAIVDIFGEDRELSVSREMTKLHEETVRGRAADVFEELRDRKPRGEYTLVIRGTGARKGAV